MILKCFILIAIGVNNGVQCFTERSIIINNIIIIIIIIIVIIVIIIKIIFSEVLDKQCMPNKVYSSHILHAFEVLLFWDFDCIRILFWKNVVSVLPSVSRSQHNIHIFAIRICCNGSITQPFQRSTKIRQTHNIV